MSCAWGSNALSSWYVPACAPYEAPPAQGWVGTMNQKPDGPLLFRYSA